MEIIYLDEIDSTHRYLINRVKSNDLNSPTAISADKQVDGVGSRGNVWEGYDGNLFLSFCIDEAYLPSDLPKPSMSIYFSFLMKEILNKSGSNVWLKWPNDFYIGEKKVGGTITTIIKGKIICSIGLNLKNAPEKYQKLDISIDKKYLLKKYFTIIEEKSLLWKEIFRKFRVEFEQSKMFLFHDKDHNKRICLKNAVLCEDGSIQIEDKRIYSLR